jgi:hypothetical protein
MGMMLRRHSRKGESVPTVNGKPVKQDAKLQNLANVQTKPNTTIPSNKQK